ASVVGDGARAVGVDLDQNRLAESGHRLVDRIIDDLPDEVMQSARAGISDVHRGTSSHMLDSLEHFDHSLGVLAAGVGCRSLFRDFFFWHFVLLPGCRTCSATSDRTA